MLISAYLKCYSNESASRDEYMIISTKCPFKKEFCAGGEVFVGEKSIEYRVLSDCEYYDSDSFKTYDNCIECNFGEEDEPYE